MSERSQTFRQGGETAASRSGAAISALWRWLEAAAAGFSGLTSLVRARRALRLWERPDGVFRLEHRGRIDGEAVGDGIVIADGAFAQPLQPSVRAALLGAQVEIVLQARHFVVRPLELPARAAEFLDGVVRAQIDRLTPWKADEAAFATTVPESLSDDRIAVRVVAAPRARLSSFVRALVPAGVDAIVVSTEIERDGAAEKVCVLSERPGDAERRRRGAIGLAIGLGLALAAAVAALAAWSYLGPTLDARREALESAIAGRRAALQAERGGADIDAVAALDRDKRSSPPVVLALEALAKALPDGTYLTEIGLEQGKLEISGVTDDAPRLIGLLEQSRRFAHAAFSAPTTRAANEAGERFHIEARVEPNGAPTP